MVQEILKISPLLNLKSRELLKSPPDIKLETKILKSKRFSKVSPLPNLQYEIAVGLTYENFWQLVWRGGGRCGVTLTPKLLGGEVVCVCVCVCVCMCVCVRERERERERTKEREKEKESVCMCICLWVDKLKLLGRPVVRVCERAREYASVCV